MNSAKSQSSGKCHQELNQARGILQAAERRRCNPRDSLEWIFQASPRSREADSVLCKAFKLQYERCGRRHPGLSRSGASRSAPQPRPSPAHAPRRLRGEAPGLHMIAVTASAKRVPPS